MNHSDAEAATRCPHCGKRFRVSSSQLEAAHGSVRCGVCKRIFDARSSIDSRDPDRVGGERLAMVSAQVGDLPLELPEKARSPLWLTILLATLCLIAIITATTQLYLWNWSQLRVHPTAGPVLEQVCQHVSCPSPRGNALDMLVSDGLVVRTHPQYQGALAVDLRLYNRAPFSQPWPDLLFVFSNLSGETVAARRFRPDEYLSKDQTAELLAPGIRSRIHLDMLDPGPEASSYVVEFLPAS